MIEAPEVLIIAVGSASFISRRVFCRALDRNRLAVRENRQWKRDLVPRKSPESKSFCENKARERVRTGESPGTPTTSEERIAPPVVPGTEESLVPCLRGGPVDQRPRLP
jgi:hypothetical protein